MGLGTDPPQLDGARTAVEAREPRDRPETSARLTLGHDRGPVEKLSYALLALPRDRANVQIVGSTGDRGMLLAQIPVLIYAHRRASLHAGARWCTRPSTRAQTPADGENAR